MNGNQKQSAPDGHDVEFAIREDDGREVPPRRHAGRGVTASNDAVWAIIYGVP